MRAFQFYLFKLNFSLKVIFFLTLVQPLFVPSSSLHAQQCRAYPLESYSFTNSGFTFNNLDCDPCVFGSPQAAQSYCCRKECQEARLNCGAMCSQLSGLAAIGACMDGCNTSLENCMANCGPIPIIRRNPIAYGWGVLVWVSDGLLAPPTNVPPSFAFTTGATALSGAPPPSPSILFPPTLLPINKAHCIFSYLRVFYDDGSCCDFRLFRCVDIG
jgi:hypothetical protein